jgi:hypothetical protein
MAVDCIALNRPSLSLFVLCFGAGPVFVDAPLAERVHAGEQLQTCAAGEQEEEERRESANRERGRVYSVLVSEMSEHQLASIQSHSVVRVRAVAHIPEEWCTHKRDAFRGFGGVWVPARLAHRHLAI